MYGLQNNVVSPKSQSVTNSMYSNLLKAFEFSLQNCLLWQGNEISVVLLICRDQT